MKKLFKYLFIIVFLTIILSPILNVSAETDPTLPCKYAVGDQDTPINSPCGEYKLLTPLPNGTNGETKTLSVAETSSLGQYLNIIIKIIIGLCAVFAVFMIFLGGIEYMTAEIISNKEEGKDRIKNAILGLILALSAYTLLYTINPDLLNSSLSTLTPATLTNLSEDIPQKPVNGKYSLSGTLYSSGADWFTIATPPIVLTAGIASMSPSTECTKVGQQSCTSLRGLNVNAINSIHSQCPQCELTITGGTEFWLHSVNTTHRPGSSTIDLRSADATKLNTFLSGGKPLVLMKRYPTASGQMLYLYEGDHWHIGP